MIRITSQQQALSLKGKIHELALIRALQFQGEGYNPDIHRLILFFGKKKIINLSLVEII